jgi:peptide/nickel transport system permease protein
MEQQANTAVLPHSREGRQVEHTRLWKMGRFVRRQPLGVAGGFVVLLLILSAVFASALAPYDPKEAMFDPYHAPTQTLLLGTDHLGRDIFSRVLWGARLSLYVGLVSVTVGITLGSLWGIVSGFLGGLVDHLSQRVVDTLMAFPPLILALGLMAVLQQSVHNVIITIAILMVPTAARTLRSTTLSLKEMGYIEASLSFLGLGAPADEPSWGGMLNAGAHAIQRAPWIALFPGLAISLTVFGLNMLGDALRDLTDVRLRGRGSQSQPD